MRQVRLLSSLNLLRENCKRVRPLKIIHSKIAPAMPCVMTPESAAPCTPIYGKNPTPKINSGHSAMQ